MNTRQTGSICAVPECGKTVLDEGKLNNPLKLFHFPKQPAQQRLWLNAVGNEGINEKNVRYHRVCSDHFLPIYINRNRHLYKNTVPTINLREEVHNTVPAPLPSAIPSTNSGTLRVRAHEQLVNDNYKQQDANDEMSVTLSKPSTYKSIKRRRRPRVYTKMEKRLNILREMKICRFCLNEEEHLTNIYEKDGKNVVPLPVQIMACVAIEVFISDGMPQLICKTCRFLTHQAYNFKTACKRSDDALKLYLTSGNLVKPSNLKFLYNTDEVDVLKVEKFQHPKKRISQESPTNVIQKKSKPSSPEFVTLNYSNVDAKHTTLLSEVSQHSMEDENTNESEQQIIELENMEPLEDISGDQEYHEQVEEEEISSKVGKNAVFKVPQVKTDVFACSHCERSFPLEQLLEIHMKNHVRDRTFVCNDCGRKFFTKYDLGKHLQTHSDIKPYPCVVCNKQFSRESLLHRHEKIHNDAPKYLCTFCERTFLTREDLDIHVEKHKKKRPFACRLCNKSFVFKQGLERHEQTHADQKPHKCNYCEASFTSPIKLTRHITSHAGLRPYPCKQCGRTFLLSHHLTRHMRSHYAAKSCNVPAVGEFKCDVCSMSFRRKDSLINHSAIHSMVNLKCVICNTAFESAKMVKEHITTHLSGLAYPCDKCDYSFDTQDQLEEHELKHAEMEYEEQIEKEVTMEAQAQNEEEYDSDDESVTEFTITNPENLELIRRSKRDTKIKNYAQFLKDELGSDAEDEVSDSSQQNQIMEEEEQEPIKPVIRSEGTKVYMRKTATLEKPRIIPIIKPTEVQTAPLEEITQPSFDSLELSKQAVHALGNKKFVDMKIGAKTVRVQKLMMTKAEIEAMAREGKIEMKGNTILLKKSRSTDLQDKIGKAVNDINTPQITFNTLLQKQLLKKTYIKKGDNIAPGTSGIRNIDIQKSEVDDMDIGSEEQGE